MPSGGVAVAPGMPGVVGLLGGSTPGGRGAPVLPLGIAHASGISDSGELEQPQPNVKAATLPNIRAASKAGAKFDAGGWRRPLLRRSVKGVVVSRDMLKPFSRGRAIARGGY